MELKIFSGQANIPLAHAITRSIGKPLGKMNFKIFADGEHREQFSESIRGSDVFLVQPMSPPVDANLAQLGFMIDAAKRASADRITFVIPYLSYQRQDRKDRPRVSISAAKVIRDLEHAAEGGGTRYRALLMDLHSEQLEGVFRCPIDHLAARPVFVDYYRNTVKLNSDELVVVSPDLGSVKRAASYANKLSTLEEPVAFVYKVRTQEGGSEARKLIGDVAGKHVLIVDDMIDTGGTLVKAARLLKEQGARDIYACCTHGLLSKDAPEKIRDSAIHELCVSDTIRPSAAKIRRSGGKIKALSVARLLGEAIKRIHENDSITTLFETEGIA